MSGSVNKVVLVGNLGRDPEIRHTNSGKKIANFPVATSETWKDMNGERQERTEWHRVVVFNSATAEFAEKFLKKGAKVYVEGQLQTRKWQDQTGADRFSTEVVITAFKGELVALDRIGAGEMSVSGDDMTSWDSTPAPVSAPTADDFDDEIPF